MKRIDEMGIEVCVVCDCAIEYNKDIYPKTDNSMYDTSMALKKIITTLRYLEDYDYEKLVQIIRSYC